MKRSEVDEVLRALNCCGTKGRFICGSCPFRDTETLSSCQSEMHRRAAQVIEWLNADDAQRDRIRAGQTYRRNRDERLTKMHDYYEARKSAGLCVRCGKAPPEEGKVTCAACAEKMKAASQKRKPGRKEHK